MLWNTFGDWSGEDLLAQLGEELCYFLSNHIPNREGLVSHLLLHDVLNHRWDGATRRELADKLYRAVDWVQDKLGKAYEEMPEIARLEFGALKQVLAAESKGLESTAQLLIQLMRDVRQRFRNALSSDARELLRMYRTMLVALHGEIRKTPRK